MGCSLSCRSSSCGVKNMIRVVHLNGLVQDFDHPVSVSEVTGTDRPPKQFLCTPAQLLSDCSQLGLQPDTILQAGHIYFLLPYSTLQSDVSHVSLASIGRKLTAKAKSTKPNSSTQPASTPLWPSPDSGLVSCRAQRLSRMRPWKPVLDTIRDKSFNRRSESDLQEGNLVQNV
ncbi:hypothetical protein ES319_A05G002900v1 [Gossypium barbadense]|uniref:DUF4228 domain-containing protein n=2 Tax=Gossypium TaxID=3633 RepID=A0A2P5VZA1_GOSBA|nr:hypothetical protein ES319_A05G002900v1 [Gossypium barbadense]PPR84168.1 hypothetical protein GOBAR_AA36537 [Gossypium barbadense]TYH14918.1 hypothetical protein ES288_A05G002900v1 [Gossypium darwinii]